MSDAVALVERPASVAVITAEEPGVAIVEGGKTAIVAEAEIAVVATVGAPQGLPSATGGLDAILIAQGDVATRLLFTMPAAGIVSDLSLVVREAWNAAGAALAIVANPGARVLMGADQNALGLAASFESTPGVKLSAGDQIVTQYTAGTGGSLGLADLVLSLSFEGS
jgi:Tfp pilus assembly protein PilW